MRGRKPVPTPLKLLRGNPGQRPIKPVLSLSAGLPPEFPEALGEEARAEWDRVLMLLSGTRLLEAVDRAALVAYCVAWARWLDAERKVAKLGSLIKSPRQGTPIQNPYVAIANNARDAFVKIAAEFGMTPVSRTRLADIPRAKTKDQGQKWAGLLG